MGLTYATEEVKATGEYKRAIALEDELLKDFPSLFGTGREVDAERFEEAAKAWEEAGFHGWAENYRAAVRRKEREGVFIFEHRKSCEPGTACECPAVEG